MRGWLLPALTAALLASAASAVRAQGCDCDNISLESVPVCGTNGATYINRCIAECQGQGVLYDAACGAANATGEFPGANIDPGKPGSGQTVEGIAAPPAVNFSDPSKFDTSGKIDGATLMRFSEEGYSFAAKIILQQALPQERGLVGSLATQADVRPLANATTLTAARVTRDGYLYLKPILPEDMPGLGGASAENILKGSPPNATRLAGAQPKAMKPGGRKMLLVGADDRFEVHSSDVPWSMVGYLEATYKSEPGMLSTCSGSLIGPKTVLTAGHCMYDTESRQFVNTQAFYPNLHDGEYTTKANVEHWDTFFNNAQPPTTCSAGQEGKCQTLQDFFYDFAIATLEEPVGDEYGWFSVGYNCDYKVYNVTTAGYPSDKKSYRMWATNGTLNGFRGCEDDLKNNLVSSNIDAAPGQSGSGIWTYDDENGYVIRATHNAGGPYHRVVSDWVLEFIQEVMQKYGDKPLAT